MDFVPSTRDDNAEDNPAVLVQHIRLLATAITETNQSITNKVVPALTRLNERFDDLRLYVGERFADIELSLRGMNAQIKGLELVDAALGKEIRATESAIIGAISARLNKLESEDAQLDSRVTEIEQQLKRKAR